MGIAAAEVFGKVLEAAGKDLTREKFLAAYNTIDNFRALSTRGQSRARRA